MLGPLKDAIGEFKVPETGKWFTYRLTTDEWALSKGLIHEISVLDGVRFARVRKTVAAVCVDEKADGSADLQAWKISNHTQYV